MTKLATMGILHYLGLTLRFNSGDSLSRYQYKCGTDHLYGQIININIIIMVSICDVNVMRKIS